MSLFFVYCNFVIAYLIKITLFWFWIWSAARYLERQRSYICG